MIPAPAALRLQPQETPPSKSLPAEPRQPQHHETRKLPFQASVSTGGSPHSRGQLEECPAEPLRGDRGVLSTLTARHPTARPSGRTAFRRSPPSPCPGSGWARRLGRPFWTQLLGGLRFEDLSSNGQGGCAVPRLGSAWAHACQRCELGWAPDSLGPSFSHANWGD